MSARWIFRGKAMPTWTSGELVAAMVLDLPRSIQESGLAHRVNCSASKADRFAAIRAFYAFIHDQILRSPTYRWGVDPYEVDWLAILSPIELVIWNESRSTGVVLYPQYPIGRFFADFANPLAKVVIECDGKAFHTDEAADEARQAEIERRGWTVYRISGRDCNERERGLRDAAGYEIGRTSAAGRFLQDIATRHALSVRYLARDSGGDH